MVLRQSRVFVFIGWKIRLCMVLGLEFSKDLYFVMTFLQLSVVCLVVILCAAILAFLLMVAISSIHRAIFVEFVGGGEMVMLGMSWRVWMSGRLPMLTCGCWHVTQIALWMLWCIVSCFFQAFCYVRGRNPPWILALCGSGGVGFVIHVFSMH